MIRIRPKRMRRWRQLRASGARLCFVALGSPKQEIFAARCVDRVRGTGLLCIGAALDFIAGKQVRAPKLAQRNVPRMVLAR